MRLSRLSIVLLISTCAAKSPGLKYRCAWMSVHLRGSREFDTSSLVKCAAKCSIDSSCTGLIFDENLQKCRYGQMTRTETGPQAVYLITDTSEMDGFVEWCNDGADKMLGSTPSSGTASTFLEALKYNSVTSDNSFNSEMGTATLPKSSRSISESRFDLTPNSSVEQKDEKITSDCKESVSDQKTFGSLTTPYTTESISHYYSTTSTTDHYDSIAFTDPKAEISSLETSLLQGNELKSSTREGLNQKTSSFASKEQMTVGKSTSPAVNSSKETNANSSMETKSTTISSSMLSSPENKKHSPNLDYNPTQSSITSEITHSLTTVTAPKNYSENSSQSLTEKETVASTVDISFPEQPKTHTLAISLKTTSLHSKENSALASTEEEFDDILSTFEADNNPISSNVAPSSTKQHSNMATPAISTEIITSPNVGSSAQTQIVDIFTAEMAEISTAIALNSVSSSGLQSLSKSTEQKEEEFTRMEETTAINTISPATEVNTTTKTTALNTTAITTSTAIDPFTATITITATVTATSHNTVTSIALITTVATTAVLNTTVAKAYNNSTSTAINSTAATTLVPYTTAPTTTVATELTTVTTTAHKMPTIKAITTTVISSTISTAATTTDLVATATTVVHKVTTAAQNTSTNEAMITKVTTTTAIDTSAAATSNNSIPTAINATAVNTLVPYTTTQTSIVPTTVITTAHSAATTSAMITTVTTTTEINTTLATTSKHSTATTMNPFAATGKVAFTVATSTTVATAVTTATTTAHNTALTTAMITTVTTTTAINTKAATTSYNSTAPAINTTAATNTAANTIVTTTAHTPSTIVAMITRVTTITAINMTVATTTVDFTTPPTTTIDTASTTVSTAMATAMMSTITITMSINTIVVSTSNYSTATAIKTTAAIANTIVTTTAHNTVTTSTMMKTVITAAAMNTSAAMTSNTSTATARALSTNTTTVSGTATTSAIIATVTTTTVVNTTAATTFNNSTSTAINATAATNTAANTTVTIATHNTATPSAMMKTDITTTATNTNASTLTNNSMTSKISTIAVTTMVATTSAIAKSTTVHNTIASMITITTTVINTMTSNPTSETALREFSIPIVPRSNFPAAKGDYLSLGPPYANLTDKRIISFDLTENGLNGEFKVIFPRFPIANPRINGALGIFFDGTVYGCGIVRRTMKCYWFRDRKWQLFASFAAKQSFSTLVLIEERKQFWLSGGLKFNYWIPSTSGVFFDGNGTKSKGYELKHPGVGHCVFFVAGKTHVSCYAAGNFSQEISVLNANNEFETRFKLPAKIGRNCMCIYRPQLNSLWIMGGESSSNSSLLLDDVHSVDFETGQTEFEGKLPFGLKWGIPFVYGQDLFVAGGKLEGRKQRSDKILVWNEQTKRFEKKLTIHPTFFPLLAVYRVGMM